DKYFPEFTVPLLYWYGLLTITKSDPVTFVRWGMALQVLLGQFILARIAAKYHHNRTAGYACMLVLLLTPMLYFYARIGLSEGMQFLLMAYDLWLLYELWQTQDARKATYYSMGSAALIALILLSKITSIGLCIGLTITTITAIFMHPAITHRW